MFGTPQVPLTVTGPTSVTYGSTGTATAAGGSGTGALTFSAGTSTGCSVSGTTVSGGNASGSCTLTATKAADNTYSAVTSAPFSVTLNKASQSIGFTTAPPGSAVYGAGFAVVASATSGLAVSYGNGGGCSNAAGAYTMTSGTTPCTVKVDQAGDANYQAAVQLSQDVTASKAGQSITVNVHAPASAVYDTSFVVAATASSGLAVGYGAGGSCNSAGATFTMTSGTGTCSVHFNQAGDGNYTAAPQVSESTAAQKAGQAAFSVAAPSDITYGSSATAAGAGGSGTGALSFSAGASTGCGVSGTTVSVSNATGSCALTATKTADSNYNAATSAAFIVTLHKAQLTVTADNATRPYGSNNPTLTATLTGFQSGQSLLTSGVTGTASCTTPALPLSVVAGSPYSIACAQGTLSSNNYDFAPFVPGSLTVTKPVLTIRADDRIKYYAMTITLNDTGFTASGLFSPDAVAGVSLNSTGVPVTASAGGYSIVPSAAEGIGLDNYSITYVNGTLTVLGIDYNCYETKVQGQPDRRVSLTDQFASHDATAQTVERFCNPATVGAPPAGVPDISESWVHMTWYRITAKVRSFQRIRVTIANQLGTSQRMTVETTPRFVMVPTQKITHDGVETGLGDPSATNHYTCYQVTGSGGGIRLAEDGFGTETKKLVKPVFLCAPSHATFGGTTTPADSLTGAHLVCYQAARNKKSDHTVTVKDQFGGQTLNTRLTGFTCLSSIKTLG